MSYLFLLTAPIFCQPLPEVSHSFSNSQNGNYEAIQKKYTQTIIKSHVNIKFVRRGCCHKHHSGVLNPSQGSFSEPR